MNFIDQLVIPPTANHVLLLKYIFIVSLLLFLPYLAMMMGASFISVYLNGKGGKSGNNMLSRFAKDVIEKLAITKNAELGLGIAPLLSIIFIYAQLLYQAPTITVSVMGLALILFIAGFISIYKYRGGFEVVSVINSISGQAKGNEEVKEFEEKLVRNSGASGKIGTTLLYLAAYFFVGCTALAANPERWPEVNNILQVMFSWATIFNFIYLLSLSGIITGAAILFLFFKWPLFGTDKTEALKNIEGDYAKFIKTFAIRLAFVSSLILPVMMFLSFLFLPNTALSNDVFLFIIIIIVLALVASNFLYIMFKDSETKYAVPVFFMVIVIFAFSVFKDESALGNALQQQTYTLVQKSDEFEKVVKSKVVTTSGISGEEIYNTKCIACHKFDVKVVGPPYMETVPKYNGDVQKLADFIFNPTPKNPGYPPMPNQGLKKKEAVAAAQFLIDKVASMKK